MNHESEVGGMEGGMEEKESIWMSWVFSEAVYSDRDSSISCKFY